MQPLESLACPTAGPIPALGTLLLYVGSAILLYSISIVASFSTGVFLTEVGFLNRVSGQRSSSELNDSEPTIFDWSRQFEMVILYGGGAISLQTVYGFTCPVDSSIPILTHVLQNVSFQIGLLVLLVTLLLHGGVSHLSNRFDFIERYQQHMKGVLLILVIAFSVYQAPFSLFTLFLFFVAITVKLVQTDSWSIRILMAFCWLYLLIGFVLAVLYIF
ncbi:hypothetical protein [Haladaptatus cibarius]|uniref:hypothetical protein n=1 Tax=Haladaptatus cibarius TaxID=453847 RepID=UPI00067971F4|nr:hypothetical protein [Haladaptatus cibarius]